jgi:drug/metabolite transporter (DMT)-like permease
LPVPFRLFPSARRISRRDWLVIAVLALVGQFVYQLCFLGGIARTTVANSALIQGCSPVVITLMAAAVGQETVGRRHWAGLVLSLAGIYLLVGAGASLSSASFVGDALMLGGVCCWGSYVVASRPLLERYSPLAVSGYSMAMGTLLYLPLGLPSLARLDWSAVSPAAWTGLVYSAVFSLFLAYLVWYTSIKRVGNVRTAMYSNLIPIIALATAVVFLGDRLSVRQAAGAAAVLVGVALARLGASQTDAPPAEE